MPDVATAMFTSFPRVRCPPFARALFSSPACGRGQGEGVRLTAAMLTTLLLIAASVSHAAESSKKIAPHDIPLADFARHAAFRDIKISPEGDYLAASAVVDGKAVLSLVHLDDMKGINLRPREGGEVYEFWWVAPHRVFYSVAERMTTLEQPLLTGELYGVNADGTRKQLMIGYRANRVAQALRRGQLPIIGFLPGDIQNPFFARIAHDLEVELRNQGHNLLIASSEESVDQERELLERVFRNADALSEDVAVAMQPPLPAVDADASVDQVYEGLSGGSGAVVVVSAGRPAGILTRSDLLEFLAARRSQVD